MNHCPTCGTEYPDNIRFCPHDGTALVQVGVGLNDPFIGQVLAGRYEVQSKLGEGAMGSVYKARDCNLGRTIAVKVLHPEVFSNADARHRFLREARLAASINHPNAVAVHDFGETESKVTFLAMEYIEGQSLRELLKKEGPLSLARVVNIVQQVAAALDAAHGLKIIHRDLKPENIIVMAGDRVKVVDFGIAKVPGGQEGLGTITQDGFLVGTPQYMSPEQVAGESLDARSDVYSLALVTYEMLTGTVAFVGDSWQAQMVIRLSEPPRPMSVAVPQVAVPASIESVVRQALVRRLADRPASAGAFAELLKKALHDGTTLVQVGVGLNDPFIGQVLAGRYEVQSKLGEGAMGSVYKARDCNLGRTIVVKVLHPEVFSNAGARHRFLREARLAASINHPNAVAVHDFGETESKVTFLAMEYIEGQSLRELLKKEGPLSLARVVNIVQQVAAALDAAHGLKIIHRDIKPDNIMVMAGDRVKVVDFGIAKALDGREGLGTITKSGFVAGTPLYMSPEQVAGESLDARSDVYSLALVTYEMLTGTRAFAGDSLQAQITRRLLQSPRRMSDAAPHVTIPDSIEAVVRQGLARQPADRPASAGAFAERLASAHAWLLDAQAVAGILGQIDSLLTVGNFDLALRLVNEALVTNPTSPKLRIKKADILLGQENFVESEAIVQAVLRSYPDYGPAYLYLGRLQERQGKVAEAIASHKRCLELNPEPEYACYAHTRLMTIYRQQYLSDHHKFAARLSEIEMEAQRAIAVAPRKSLEVRPRLVLAELFINRQQYTPAREQIEKLLQDNAFPDKQLHALAYYQLARITSFENKYAEAAEAAERATQLDPQNKDYQKLARTLRQYRR